MRCLLTRLLVVAATAATLVASDPAAGDDDDDNWRDVYRTQLRRDAVERARERRDKERQTQKDGKRTNPFGIDVANPFGPGLNLGNEAWGNADRGKYELFPNRSRERKKRRQPNAQPLDLNGRPLNPIQVTRLRPPPAQPPAKKEPDKGDKKEEGSADASASGVVKAAQLLYNNGEYGAARRMLLPIAASRRRPPAEVDAAKKFIERIDTEGMKRLMEADENAANGNLDAAARAYAEIVGKFGSAPAARLARDKLVVLRKNPDVAAKFLLDRAKEYVQRKRLDVAMPLLVEIVRKYDKSQYAADAAALLEQLKRRAAAERALTGEQVLAARRWLIIGDIHALNGRRDRAIESYHLVVQDFADSRYGERAAKIAALKKKETQ